MLPETIDWTVRECLDNFDTQVESFKILCGCSEDLEEEIHIELSFRKVGSKVTITAYIKESECKKPMTINLSLESDEGSLQVERSEQIHDDKFIKEYTVTKPSVFSIYAEVNFSRSKSSVSRVCVKSMRMEMLDIAAVPGVDNISKADLSDILFKKEFSDLTILVDGCTCGHAIPELYVHKAILASRNSTFAHILKKFKGESFLKFEGLGFEQLEQIITYIYTGNMTSETLYSPTQMLESLAMFGFEDMTESSEAYVIEQLSPENIVEALIIAEDYRLPKLRKAAANYFVAQYEDIDGDSKLKEIEDRELLWSEIAVRYAIKSSRNFRIRMKNLEIKAKNRRNRREN